MWRFAVVAGTLAAAPAAAQPPQPAPQITAEEAMAAYRATLRPVAAPCPQPRDGEEVVVCARPDNDRYRAPLYAAPETGPAVRAGGEQRAALALDSSPCTPVGRDQRCGGGLPVFAIIAYAVRVVTEIIRGDD